MVEPPNPRRTLLGLSALGLVLIVSLVLLSRVGGHMVERHLPLAEAAYGLRRSLALFEANYVGHIHGDATGRGRSSSNYLDEAERWTLAIRTGAPATLGYVEPTHDPELRDLVEGILTDLSALRSASARCHADLAACQALRGEIAALIADADARGASVEEHLREVIAADVRRHRALRNGALAASLLLAVGVGIAWAAWARAWARAYETTHTWAARLSREVEERRLVEAELRESEGRFRVMADGAPMLMWVADPEMRFEFINQTWLEFTGRPRASQLGHGWAENVHADDRERLRQALRTAFEKRSAFQVEYRLRRADGEYRWLLHRGVPRFDGDGGFVGFIGSCVDITGRRRAEDALRDSEGRFRAMAEAAYDPVLLIDESGRITHWNPAGESVFGYSESEILGRRFLDVLVPDEWREAATDALRKFRLAGTEATPGQTVEADGRRKDGVLIPVELSVAPLAIAGRWHAIGIARDISERRRAEAVGAFIRETIEAVVEGAPAPALLGTAASRLRQIVGYDEVFVALREGGTALVVRAHSGAQAVDERALAVAHAALRAGQLQRETEDQRTILAVPLAVPGRSLGVLGVTTTRADLAEARQHRHLLNVAAQLAAALVRAEDQRQLRLHGTALSAAANAILIMAEDGRIQWVNPAFSELSGYDADEALGRDLSFLDSGKDGTGFYEEVWKTVRGGWTWRGEVVARRKDGTPFIVYQTITPLQDENGRNTHFIAVHTDVTAQREVEKKLLHLAHHDDLTGLPNRALFTRHLRRAISSFEREGSTFAVLLLDLDRFKDVNDTLGHPVGDLLLKAVGGRLLDVVRPSDTVARFGGDEFAVLQPDIAHSGEVAALAQKVIDALAGPFALGDHEIHTAASIGVAVYAAGVADPEELLVQADTALYKSKEEGRGTYRFHTDAMQQEVVERVVLQGDLRRAVDRDEFSVFYQPQVDLTTERIVGMEALVRWRHPHRGLLTPGRFIRVAEDSGLVVQMGQLVLQVVCRQARAWLDAGLDPRPVAVNLSANQFKTGNLAQQVLDVLDAERLAPELLELELTETILMQSSDRVDPILTRLHDAGVRFSIDDFGTGYSSLQYLKRFPIYKLKIAQEFVRDLGHDSSDAAIVAAVIGLAGSLGLKVIAEGVETIDHVDFLRKAGCQEAQGYYFFHPVPAGAMTELLMRERSGSGAAARATPKTQG